MDVLQQSVEHEDVVQFGYLLLLWIKLNFDLRDFPLEDFLPLSFEFLAWHNGVVRIDAGVGLEHGRVPVAEFEIYFAHVPFPGRFIELGEVLGEEVDVDVADVFELDDVVVAVELEGAVHDAAVVETGDGEVVVGL